MDSEVVSLSHILVIGNEDHLKFKLYKKQRLMFKMNCRDCKHRAILLFFNFRVM